jgi:hypothetical protein
MLHSEISARSKWCPMVRIEGGNRLYNTNTDGFENSSKMYHCIGSQCMAWRDLHLSHMKGSVEGEQKHGYCGLSGKPDLETGW